MPSINTLITGLAITALSVFQVASAVPTPQVSSARRPFPVGPGKVVPSAVASSAISSATPVTPTVPTLPVNGGATELPAPTTSLVAVAVGRGIQNYTCTAVGAVPVSIGAIATLFDATSLASSDPSALHALTASAVDVPQAANGCFNLPPSARLSRLGNHFFAADGTPNFVLNGGKSIQAKKNVGIAAPATATKGPIGTGAVDWLQLISKPAPYISVGLSTVYRVETAGGMQTPTCATVGTLSVQYAAEYWFYS